MPIYEYRCQNCGATSEFLVGVSSQPETLRCAACGAEQLERKLSAFAVGASRQESSCCGGGACEGGSCQPAQPRSSHSCGAGCACGH